MAQSNLQAAIALLLVPTAAFAFQPVDEIPYPARGGFPDYPAEERRLPEIWVQGGAMRDDNILRQQNNEQADTVTRAGAGIRHEVRVVGRQRVALEARLDRYEFDRFKQLDHTAYGLLGEWRWEVGNDLSGTLGASRRRQLVDLGEVQPAAPIRDLVTENRLYFTGAYRVGPNLRVRGGVEHNRNDRSVGQAAETRGTGITVGADYVTALNNFVGVEARAARGDAPVQELVAGTLIDNDFKERELSLVAGYSPSAVFRLGGRIGRTQREYTQLPGRDFSGNTWRATADWLPGGKTRLGFAVWREPRSIIDVAASHVLTQGVSFGPSWAPTIKLVFSGRVFREKREYEGDPALQLVPGTALRNETLRGVRLAVGWEIQRGIEISGALDRGERESNIAGRSYDYTAAMANLRWSF